MKKSIKFLMIFALVFIVAMLTQMFTNSAMAYTTYIYGNLEYKWNSTGYWIVDDIYNEDVYNLTIPARINGWPVKEMDDYALAFCSNLVYVSIPNTMEKIGANAFDGDDGLEEIIIPSSVKTIGSEAFDSCRNLSSVKLNEGLEMIGAEAFRNCEALRSIVIPSSVEFIGVDAFNTHYGRQPITIYGSRNSVAETYANKNDYAIFVDKDMPFMDVPSNSWYYNAVKYVFSKGIMTGFTDTEFGPDAKLTRGMFITILYKKEGAPYASPVNQFVDLYSGAYYCSAVTWGVDNGIISGYDSRHFGPDDLITREQIAVILQQYCKYKGNSARSTGNLTTYSDYKNVSSYATWGMKWAVGSGVITGSNGKLNPRSYATRAEAAAMIQKYCYSYE